MPYRIPAPPEPDTLDVEEPYAAVLRAQRRNARIAGVLVVVALAGGVVRVARSHPPPRRPVTEAVRTERARVAIAGARARAASAQVRFDGVMRGAVVDDVVPRPDSGRLPGRASGGVFARREPLGVSAADRRSLGDRRTIAQSSGGRCPDRRAPRRSTSRSRSLRGGEALRARARSARALRLRRRARGAKQQRAARAVGSRLRTGRDRSPRLPLRISSGRVVCAGDVAAKSSHEIGYVYIRLQIERAIVAALRWRSGPRL